MCVCVCVWQEGNASNNVRNYTLPTSWIPSHQFQLRGTYLKIPTWAHRRFSMMSFNTDVYWHHDPDCQVTCCIPVCEFWASETSSLLDWSHATTLILVHILIPFALFYVYLFSSPSNSHFSLPPVMQTILLDEERDWKVDFKIDVLTNCSLVAYHYHDNVDVGYWRQCQKY